ncbi:FAD-binding oxidoreductase [Loktanella sp. D2R18]|uniref:FAD-binding and (Fe-S)-binding domain-containing protein n=1 Tax=Rhodobacterales TaxID=204455 RepID=UPI000DE9B5D9|nr:MULTISPECIES: FAD-binding and (Fe-S)-binding domain-containing protein [Rhodobacterales]MDO6589962.1 FAD-linked oxidase C-terminal domain-containing protein [Yoonia sp. 1_MG-2023]RBW45898.1 FAD-binding oxidoreductase [Loktanella sp. D2R18]
MRKNSRLASRLGAAVAGDVSADPATRARYATDASIYQMVPQAVVVPQSVQDVEATMAVARDEGLPILARGGGTSQCGQTVNTGIVLDNSRHLNRILDIDPKAMTARVEPGLVLDDLNRALKPHGLWFPVDPSTASRCTLGGMAANNSSGGKSLRYGIMRDNVSAISAILPNGSKARFDTSPGTGPYADLVTDMRGLGQREAPEIAARFPKVQRRVGGYNIDALTGDDVNMAHLLVGSEGTLAYFTELDLRLAKLPGEKVIGVCHFSTFHGAMDAAQHLVTLNPQAVELIDNTMIALGRDLPLFRDTIDAFVQGTPAAVLLVEFAEGSVEANAAKLVELATLMGDLGFSFGAQGAAWGGVTPVADLGLQAAIAEYRKAGLNIMMSMKEAGKPISFVEDCAVALPDLAAYTQGLTDIFARHGTKGTWYAHASVGCLHVRPVLNVRQDQDVKTMRAIAEEAFDLVKHYKGSHSGEHGDGIVRSEFHEKMFGAQIVSAFEEVKTRFDPTGLMNPGKIVQAPKMDDRRLFRYGPDYTVPDFETALDWSAWPGAAGGFQGAVEMCNSNGACRKLKAGVMCPSFRATRNERDVTRGRANTLRFAISGQIPGGIGSDAMADTMKYCLSCKACSRECPTGVDMTRMKTEVLAARLKTKPPSLAEKLVGYLPRYAPKAAKISWLMNSRNKIGIIRKLTEKITGVSHLRDLPIWSPNPFRDEEAQDVNPDVLLFADVFNRYFEPENLRAGLRVLRAAGLRVAVAKDGSGTSLDCGRTLLAIGDVPEARKEAARVIAATKDAVATGASVVGLEPSSIFTFRDEFLGLCPGEEAEALAKSTYSFEEYLVTCTDLPLKPLGQPIYVHGHCHQKAQDAMSPVLELLCRIPDAQVNMIESGCCGMAGAFGYAPDTVDVSLKIANLDLVPALNAAPADAIIVADGTSCRHQIAETTPRRALHVACLLDQALRG